MEKFERKPGNISKFMNNDVSSQKRQDELAFLKEAEKTIRTIANAKKEQGMPTVNFDEIQKASTDGMDDITINNAHHSYSPDKPKAR